MYKNYILFLLQYLLIIRILFVEHLLYQAERGGVNHFGNVIFELCGVPQLGHSYHSWLKELGAGVLLRPSSISLLAVFLTW